MRHRIRNSDGRGDLGGDAGLGVLSAGRGGAIESTQKHVQPDSATRFGAIPFVWGLRELRVRPRNDLYFSVSVPQVSRWGRPCLYCVSALVVASVNEGV